MSWTTPRTWVTGELVDAATLNTHVRDDLLYLYANGGAEADVAENTSPVSISGTSDATATTLITGASVTYSGAAVVVQFQCPYITYDFEGRLTTFNLYVDGSDVGRMGQTNVGSSESGNGFSCWYRYTPSAGAHTLSIRAWKSDGTVTVGAGAGGAGAYVPMQMRVLAV